MNKPFYQFTATDKQQYGYNVGYLVAATIDRLKNLYTIPFEQSIEQILTLYPDDAGTETYEASIEPDEERPVRLEITWKKGDSRSMNEWRKQHPDDFPSIGLPIQRKREARTQTTASQRTHSVSPPSIPHPKPTAKPVAKVVPKPVAKVAPKPLPKTESSYSFRIVHPPRHYSPDIPQPKPKPGTVPQPKPVAKPVAVPQPKPGAKAVAVPQPKPVAKQPAANPHRVRVPIHDDDDDDSDDVPQQRRFDPGHPLQHPRDDDVPLDFLKNKSYSYIQDTIGIRGVALAKVIKEHGTSINRSREIRRNEDYDKRRERQNDREIERKIKQIERQITASELNVHNVQQNFAELKDLLGYGQEQ